VHGALGGFDEVSDVRGLLALFDIAQAWHGGSP
jgi:hypothetical protein